MSFKVYHRFGMIMADDALEIFTVLQDSTSSLNLFIVLCCRLSVVSACSEGLRT